MDELNVKPQLERVVLPRLIAYLDPSPSRRWDVCDAEITAMKIANRYGLPHRAETYRYQIYFRPGGWSVTVRSAWCDGKLYRPLTTHAVAEGYHDCEGIHGSKWIVQDYWLDWLRGLPGL